MYQFNKTIIKKMYLLQKTISNITKMYLFHKTILIKYTLFQKTITTKMYLFHKTIIKKIYLFQKTITTKMLLFHRTIHKENVSCVRRPSLGHKNVAVSQDHNKEKVPVSKDHHKVTNMKIRRYLKKRFHKTMTTEMYLFHKGPSLKKIYLFHKTITTKMYLFHKTSL